MRLWIAAIVAALLLLLASAFISFAHAHGDAEWIMQSTSQCRRQVFGTQFDGGLTGLSLTADDLTGDYRVKRKLGPVAYAPAWPPRTKTARGVKNDIFEPQLLQHLGDLGPREPPFSPRAEAVERIDLHDTKSKMPIMCEGPPARQPAGTIQQGGSARKRPKDEQRDAQQDAAHDYREPHSADFLRASR